MTDWPHKQSAPHANPPSSSDINDAFQAALERHQKGQLPDAEVLCRAILSQAPQHFDAMHLLGVLLLQKGHHAAASDLIARSISICPTNPMMYSNRGLALQALRRTEEALASYDYALQLKPAYPEALSNRGNALLDLKRLDEALVSYGRALQLKPDYVEALYNSGMVLFLLKRPNEALTFYDDALKLKPNHAEVLNARGSVLRALNREEEAIASFEHALRLNPDYAEALNNRGNALRNVGRAEEALASYDRALQIKPNFPEALNNRGTVLRALKRPNDALVDYDRALQLKPEYADALNNRGTVLHDLNRPHDALASYDRALQVKSDLAEALNNRGNALRDLKRPEDALASIERALQLRPDYPEALNSRGNVLRDLGRPDEALISYDRALQLKPGFVEALHNRGMELSTLGRHGESAAAFARLLSISPDREYALGYMFHAQLQLCDWTNFYSIKTRIASGVEHNQKRDAPFSFLVHSQDPAAQLQCAGIYAANNYPASSAPIWSGQSYRHDKIRIAYLSADFYAHATAYLMAGLFETHDSSKFEVSAISFGPDRKDDMHQRLKRSFHRFVDVQRMSDKDVAQMLLDMEIDIAVDLKGFTDNCRPGIFAHRGAPLQVGYLGFPSTMGAEYVDYILADSHVIPSGNDVFYVEKVVRLPDTYQVNDRRRRISECTPSRMDLGLPDKGFIFCCMNNNYKITPFVFDIWMRLLKRVEGSVLWLLEYSAEATYNLKREAESRGIPANRLVFGPRMELSDHLARHRCADLFLDTFPCNAHTTASDALWAGLPLLTCMGETFASRVAGSLLHAAGLPELATRNLADYEALAYQLATTPRMFADIKAKLANNRATCALFNTERFCRHIEVAYTTMYERHLRNAFARILRR